MKTNKKVLLALDYNPTAKKMAEIGYSFAKEMNADFTLLHVVENQFYYTSFASSPISGVGDFNSATFYEYLNTENLTDAAVYYLDKIKKHLNDDKIITLVVTGDYAKAILKTAKEIDADLIIMGSHSQKWLEKILIGSTTESVLNQSKIPIMIIPTKKHE